MDVHRQGILRLNLTRRVNLQTSLKQAHPQSHQPFPSNATRFNCRFRVQYFCIGGHWKG